jgi:hypothetical protein
MLSQRPTWEGGGGAYKRLGWIQVSSASHSHNGADVLPCPNSYSGMYEHIEQGKVCTCVSPNNALC